MEPKWTGKLRFSMRDTEGAPPQEPWRKAGLEFTAEQVTELVQLLNLPPNIDAAKLFGAVRTAIVNHMSELRHDAAGGAEAAFAKLSIKPGATDANVMPSEVRKIMGLPV